MPLFLFFIAACATLEPPLSSKQEMVPGMYEVCYYFHRLPAGTTLAMLEEASDRFSAKAAASGILIHSRKIDEKRACFFTDRPVLFTPADYGTPADAVQYLLSVYFTADNQSLYAEFAGKWGKVDDDTPVSEKIPDLPLPEEGVVVEGRGASIVFFRDYLDRLGFRTDFGAGQPDTVRLVVPGDSELRWLMAPFLWERFPYQLFARLKPGDVSLLDQGAAKPSLYIRLPGWERVEVETHQSAGGGRIAFGKGALTLPFGVDALLKFFYGLAAIHKQGEGRWLYYAPQFYGAQVGYQLLLFSSAFSMTSEEVMSPETLFLWMHTADKQPDRFDDRFYMNLLSLKLAMRLYTGQPSFLGGAELTSLTESVPFTEIHRTLLTPGSVTLYGSSTGRMYLYTGALFEESTVISAPGEVKGIKAFWNAPKTTEKIIAALVCRSKNARDELRRLQSGLIAAGFAVGLELFEKTGADDAWGALAVTAAPEQESALQTFYDKEQSACDATLSLGVYRVGKK